MNQASRDRYDVIVVGGGPGGSTAAALIARQGYSVLLLEKEAFPRYQIGESLLPSTIHGICNVLGVADEVKKAGFTLKRGGTFKWGQSAEPWDFVFAASTRFAGPTSTAFQVERMKFDQILLDNARRCGAEVCERCSVEAAEIVGDRVSGVVYTDAGGERHRVASRMVVDASGGRSGVYKAMRGERVFSRFFTNIAMWGYFRGAKRLPAPNGGNVFSCAFPNGWVWHIPLANDVTSVGVVVQRDDVDRLQGDREAAYRTLLAECGPVRDLLADAERITEGPYGQLRICKDYSYCHTQFWRPGMVLVGDAAAFVDPLFSSGVHLATYSGLLAARSVNSVLGGGLDEELAFSEYDYRFRREYAVFYEFLLAFYDLHEDGESDFWRTRSVESCPDAEMRSFVSILRSVAADDLSVHDPEALRRELAAASRDLREASQLVLAGDSDKNPVFTSPIVGKLMRESAKIQIRTLLTGAMGNDVPVRDGGLVESEDGTMWVTA